jgi:transposase-like protein
MALQQIVDGAFGKGVDENIRSGYMFLAQNYVPGDQIFLFGFSRGAFTARSLSGFITYIKVRGCWMYLYRAVDSNGDTVEFWFSERRNLTAAKRFLRKAIKRHGQPDMIVIDGSQTTREAILLCDAECRLQDRSRRRLKPIRVRQSQYLNNPIEQDHRTVKRRVRPLLGFKSADSARVILGGIELVHMLRKQQAKYVSNQQLSLAEQFHLLAA